MKLKFWLLGDDNIPVTCDEIEIWARWIGQEERRIIGRTTIQDTLVSTVFTPRIALIGDPELPYLFETMILGGLHHGWTNRYKTWEEALLGHDNAVKLVQELQ
jgi:hypothetical protein